MFMTHFMCVLDMECVFLNLLIHYCTNFMHRNTEGCKLQYCQSLVSYLRAYSVTYHRSTRPRDQALFFIHAVTHLKDQSNLTFKWCEQVSGSYQKKKYVILKRPKCTFCTRDRMYYQIVTDEQQFFMLQRSDTKLFWIRHIHTNS